MQCLQIYTIALIFGRDPVLVLGCILEMHLDIRACCRYRCQLLVGQLALVDREEVAGIMYRVPQAHNVPERRN